MRNINGGNPPNPGPWNRDWTSQKPVIFCAAEVGPVRPRASASGPGGSRSREAGSHDNRFQNSRAPGGTSASGWNSTTLPSASGKPRVSTSDMNLPIWRGGKLTTAATIRPTSASGA